MSDQSESTGTPPPTSRAEKERLARMAELDRQPSPNPRYRGMTPGDAARAMMRPRRVPSQPK